MSFDITAKFIDQFSQPFKQSVQQADTGIKNVEKTSKTAGDSMSASFKKAADFLGPLGIGVSVGAAIGFLKDAAFAASDLEESANAVGVVFEGAADKILKFGETAASTVALTKTEFNSLATQTGAQLTNLGYSADEAADLTLKLTQRAADMASVYNTSVSDALGAVNALLRGESEPIRRYAVNISQAALENEALAQGITKAVSEMTEQEKAALRVDLVMKQTNKTSGDFANTAGSLANQTKTLEALIGDLNTELGKLAGPIAKDTVHGLLEITRAMLGYEDSVKAVLKASFTRIFGLQHILPLLNEEEHVLRAIGNALPAALIPAEQGIPKLLQATNEQLEARAQTLQMISAANEALVNSIVAQNQAIGRFPEIQALDPASVRGDFSQAPSVPVPEVPTELPEDIRTIRDYLVEIDDVSDSWVSSIIDARESLIDTEFLTNAIAFNLGRAVHSGFNLKSAFFSIASLAATSLIPGFGGQLLSGFLGGFQTGGGVDFRVPGSGGPDSKFYGFRASPGEDVSLKVSRPGETTNNDNRNIVINNYFSRSMTDADIDNVMNKINKRIRLGQNYLNT